MQAPLRLEKDINSIIGMATETEIKLRISRQTLTALQQSPVFAGQQTLPQWRKLELQNTYYDSQDYALARAGVALRIRRDGDQLIQTLKTKGCSVAGLSERNEWDWDIEQPQLDLQLLAGDCWPQELHKLDKTRLEGIFTTDFVRQALELELEIAGQPCQLEVALDLGEVRTARASEEICELELELRQGEPQQLLELALELAASHPLMPCDISKAERGYRLLLPDSFDLQVMPARLAADMPMDAAIAALAAQLLSASQRLAEQYLHNGHWRLLEQWIMHLIWLRALLASPGQIVPRKSTSRMRAVLDAILADWQPVYLAREQQQVREQSVQKFAREMQQTRWGKLSLQLALWLQQQDWARHRSDKASRQAGVSLSRWLPRYLAQEFTRLALQQPDLALFAQQQERLERLLFWLEHARNIMAIAGLDELLGGLRKLYQACLQQDKQQLAVQSARVWQNQALRQLLKG